MFPTHLSVTGICDIPVPRLPLEFSKTLLTPRPLRQPLPAHTPSAHARPTHTHSAFPFHPANRGYQALPVLSIPPPASVAPGVAIPTPILPYPGFPIPPFAVGSPAHDIHQLNILQSFNRAQQVGPSEQHKVKTPINRNYLELAMLVCNTFRGKLFPCPHCRYVTDRRNNLKRHISTMHQTCDKQLECCGVSFSTKASLREHIMIFHHNGYSCPYCGRRFCRKALLKRHLSVHSGQKDYTCPSCDYATSHKSNLERHKRIHERLKLGEDGSLFECGDFTSHHKSHSPDTTDNSCLGNGNKGSNFVELDSADESSDVDVEESMNEENVLTNYPVFCPPLNLRRETVTSSEETGVDRRLHQDVEDTNVPSFEHFKTFNSEALPAKASSSDEEKDFHNIYKIPQQLALDFSKQSARQSSHI
ncbi:ZN358-like protein [Mya arenaria]|uniref:ZN358-like protein n=1 Tax=Mya arenaria TaxID=6604 RepID=A0ABY7G2S0_MYAAR|nr:replication initiator 1-like [Mya arenaria]WAR27559.1 ZN358-like protein [Mya arenaria]